MSLIATCPNCSTSANVTAEYNGRKVRCKNCQTSFVVDAKPAKGRPKTVPAKPSPSGIHRRGKQKSNAALWIIVGVVGFLAIGGGAAAIVVMNQAEPVKQVKAKTPKKQVEDIPKAAKERGGKQNVAAAKATVAERNDKTELAKADSRPNVNAKPLVETKMEPSVVAPMLKSMPIECKDFEQVKEVYSIANKPSRIGVRLVEKGQQRFQLYDLDKQQQVANFELPKDLYFKDNVAVMDVDPDGEYVALATIENRIHFFKLPEGGDHFEDDWAPYNQIKDEMRFLGDRKIVGLNLLSKDLCLAITENNNGDLFDWKQKRPLYHIPAIERLEYQKLELVRDRDYIISPDRSLLAIAADEGVRFMDSKDFKPLGKTAKLTKFGTKPAIAGMGFDPSGKSLGITFSAGTKDGRSYFYAKFAVPSGDETSVETLPDPGDKATIEYVNSDLFLSLQRREAVMRDAKGKIVAQCRFPGDFGLFAAKLASKKMAFLFKGDKDRAHVGLVEIPMAEAPAAIIATAPNTTPGPAAKAESGASLEELLTGKKDGEKAAPKQAAPKQQQAAPKLDAERQAIWHFGVKGIVRMGYAAR